jgi:hypothetical protein
MRNLKDLEVSKNIFKKLLFSETQNRVYGRLYNRITWGNNIFKNLFPSRALIPLYG